MKQSFSNLTEEQQSNFGNGCGLAIKILNVNDLFFTADCRHHDFNYSRGGSGLDRFKADNDFLIAMLTDIQTAEISLGKRKWHTVRALTYYRLVRLFGWVAFKYGPYRTIEEIYNGE